METMELKYFLAVTETGGVHEASRQLNTSPSTISKAISRLEARLEVQLFRKSGRNIVITKDGERLIADAKTMLAIEQSMIGGYSSDKRDLRLKIVGPEIPLSYWAPQIVRRLKSHFTDITLQIESTSNESAIQKVEDYSADFAVVSSAKKLSGRMYRLLAEVQFKTFVSKKHPLYSRRKGAIPVNEILREPFFMTEPSFLGEMSNRESPDGWRDDKLQRCNSLKVNSAKCLEGFLSQGLAVSYLPDYYGESLGLTQLQIEGCPFVCRQYLYLMRHKYSLNKVWERL